MKELRQYPIEGPKDLDYTFTREFMVKLFKILYTYQVIGKEIIKEEHFNRRLQYLQEGDSRMYEDSIEGATPALQSVQVEIKDIVFDYFNIITKEYEMAYEKWREDPEYQQQISEIKVQTDLDFVEKKFEVPTSLTKDKTQDLITKKQAIVNSMLMKAIQEEGA